MSCCTPNEQDILMLNSAKNITVACGVLIDSNNKILIAKRPEGKIMQGLWEFPGGKIEPNEAPQIALKRELKEELSIDVCTGCMYPLGFLSHRYENFHLIMLLFSCRNWEGTVTGIEGQETKWITPAELKNHPMPEANKPIITMLRQL